MLPFAASDAEELLVNVVHDLRQPLGNIEFSIYLLDLLLGEPEGKVHDQLRTIELQVDRAARMLNEAVAELGRLRVQRASAGPLDLTKSATAAVT